MRIIALLLCSVALSGCVDAFPDIEPATREASDRGPIDPDMDGGAIDMADGRVADDRGVDRPERGPDPDDGVPPVDRGGLDRGPDRDSCIIEVDPSAVTLRTWNDTGDRTQVTVQASCGGAGVIAPDWITADLDRSTLVLSTAAGRGVIEDIVTLVGPDTSGGVGVRRVGLGTGAGTRRALVYVVDGLKGESLEVSRPPAIDWLAGYGRVTWQGTPHAPIDGTSRATAWASLLTGLEPAEHQFAGQGAIAAPTFIQRLGQMQVAFAAEWPVAAGALRQEAVERREVIERSVEAIGGAARLIIAGVDGLVDARPETLASRRAQIDADLDALLAAIARRPADEDWMIVVTTASPEGEGQPRLPIILSAPRRSALMVDAASLLDVHASVLGWLGVLRPGWDLPGEQIGEAGEGNCADGLDNDGDGRIDCRDTHCAEACALGCVDVDIGVWVGTGLFERSMAGLSDDRDDCVNETGERSIEATVAWVAPRTGFFTASTDGSSFDTVLSLTSGDCEAQTEACDDDPFQIRGVAEPAAVTFRAQEGQQWLISISGYLSPGPDDRARLHVLSVADECAAAPPLDGEVRLDNRNRQMVMPIEPNDEDIVECERATANRLVRWAAPAGRWRIRAVADFPHTLALWSGGCTDLSLIGCRAGPLDVNVEEDGEYVVVFSSVWQQGGAPTGPFSLIVEPRP